MLLPAAYFGDVAAGVDAAEESGMPQEKQDDQKPALSSNWNVSWWRRKYEKIMQCWNTCS